MGSSCSRIAYSPDVFLIVLPDVVSTSPRPSTVDYPLIYRLAASEVPYRTVRAMCDDPLMRCDVRTVGGEIRIYSDQDEVCGRIKHQEGSKQFVVYIGTQFATLHPEHRCHVQYPPSTDAQTGRMIKSILRRRVEDLDKQNYTPEVVKVVQDTLPLLMFYHHPVDWSETRQRYRCALCGSKAHRTESWSSLVAHLEQEHGLSSVLIAKHFCIVHCGVCGEDLDLKEKIECSCGKRWCVESSKADMLAVAGRTDVVDPFTYLVDLKKLKRTIVDTSSPADKQNTFDFNSSNRD